MARVRFTRHLVRFFPDLGDNVEVAGETIAEVVADLDAQYPGLAAYIVNEQGGLRRHVNIFLGQEMIQDRQQLQDKVDEEDQIYVFQALSGGSQEVARPESPFAHAGGVRPTTPESVFSYAGGVRPTAPESAFSHAGGVRPTTPESVFSYAGGVRPTAPESAFSNADGVRPA